METKIHKGGTAKGVRKPHDSRKRTTCGLKAGLLDSFGDVKAACNRFLADRMERGEMKGWIDGAFQTMEQARVRSVAREEQARKNADKNADKSANRGEVR